MKTPYKYCDIAFMALEKGLVVYQSMPSNLECLVPKPLLAGSLGKSEVMKSEKHQLPLPVDVLVMEPGCSPRVQLTPGLVMRCPKSFFMPSRPALKMTMQNSAEMDGGIERRRGDNAGSS
jgi:hypothetical protein